MVKKLVEILDTESGFLRADNHKQVSPRPLTGVAVYYRTKGILEEKEDDSSIESFAHQCAIKLAKSNRFLSRANAYSVDFDINTFMYDTEMVAVSVYRI